MEEPRDSKYGTMQQHASQSDWNKENTGNFVNPSSSQATESNEKVSSLKPKMSQRNRRQPTQESKHDLFNNTNEVQVLVSQVRSGPRKLLDDYCNANVEEAKNETYSNRQTAREELL